MSSPAKKGANRGKGKKSGGPRPLSREVKASINAFKESLGARMPLIPGETETEFIEFISVWIQKLRPLGVEECFWSEQAIMKAWSLRRLGQFGPLLAEMIRGKDRKPVVRHLLHLQRTFARSIKKLKRLQAERGISLQIDDNATVQNEPTLSQLELAVVLSLPCQGIQ